MDTAQVIMRITADILSFSLFSTYFFSGYFNRCIGTLCSGIIHNCRASSYKAFSFAIDSLQNEKDVGDSL